MLSERAGRVTCTKGTSSTVTRRGSQYPAKTWGDLSFLLSSTKRPRRNNLESTRGGGGIASSDSGESVTRLERGKSPVKDSEKKKSLSQIGEKRRLGVKRTG